MVIRDRIAEPWGGRTPSGRGQPWLTRVDTYLTGDAVDHWVQSAFVLHSDGDGPDIAMKDGRIVGLRGRVNHGRLDPKDR